MSVRYCFFDLDGTLTDSAPGILSGLRYALRRAGARERSDAELMPFIGPPIVDTFASFSEIPPEKTLEYVSIYRSYYAEHGLELTQVYDGIPALLEVLKASGMKIVLATSKPDMLSERLLRIRGLLPYFDFLAAATPDHVREKKEDVIRYALDSLGIVDVSEVLMVGDRKFDVLGASAFGIPCVGVLWGYGSREELLAAGARAVISSPSELLPLLGL